MFKIPVEPKQSKYIVCPYCDSSHFERAASSIIKCSFCNETFLVRAKLEVLFTTEKIEIDLK